MKDHPLAEETRVVLAKLGCQTVLPEAWSGLSCLSYLVSGQMVVCGEWGDLEAGGKTVAERDKPLLWQAYEIDEMVQDVGTR
jgi:hypothetical protein